MQSLLSSLLALFMLALPAASWSQVYPNKPIRLIVTYAAGGITDIIARSVAVRMTEDLGQPIVVENNTGASGNIGSEFVARAAPDGYTLLLGASGPLAVNPSMMSSMPFDPIKDLAPIALLATSPGVLVINPQVPANSLKELMTLIKANPGKFSYSSSGNGGIPHLSGELFNLMTGLDVAHIPYRGDAPAMNDVVGGRVQMSFPAPGSILPLLKAGKVKAIAVGSMARSAALPDVPTLNEAGVPGYNMVGWFSLFAPAGTPPDLIRRLNAAATKALADPTLRRQFVDLGLDVAEQMTPEQFGQFHRTEIANFAKVVKAAKITQTAN